MPFYSRKHQLSKAILYHIYNRGISRRFIFEKQRDKDRFKEVLMDYVERFSLKIYHWVIMGNHYHLEAEPDEPEKLSRIMAGIARTYTHYYHREYKTSGYLWEGRFKLQPIEKEEYALVCGRYIERNPVEAKMVENAWEYAYSSARMYVEARNDGLTTIDPSFIELASSDLRRTFKYRQWLSEENKEDEVKNFLVLT